MNDTDRCDDCGDLLDFSGNRHGRDRLCDGCYDRREVLLS